MTKADIVEQIYEQVGFSKKESAELVEKVFDAIKDTLARGEKVKISGFGNFVVRDKNSRKGRNPQTGEAIKIPARKKVGFTVSKSFKDTVLGVKKKYSKMPLGAPLYIATWREGITRDIRGADASLVLENNVGMRGALEKLGARIYKTYRTYEQPL